MMLAAVVYQRRTGPTHPLRGTFELAGQTYRYRLVRSGWSTEDARVELPNAGPDLQGRLFYRRYKTDDAYSEVAMTVEDDLLVGLLPAQPAAGKLEYYIELTTPDAAKRIPDSADQNVVIRFKDPVPIYFLLPHVLLMFLAVLIGIRAGLSALFAPASMRRWSWVALAGMTVGGMILGPVVQKYAFGAFWTGWPFGYDLTDNKMLIMWLAWLVACAMIGLRQRKREWFARLTVVAATLVMTAVYLIPHSLRGSELGYSKVDQGANPAEAIGTGD